MRPTCLKSKMTSLSVITSTATLGCFFFFAFSYSFLLLNLRPYSEYFISSSSASTMPEKLIQPCNDLIAASILCRQLKLVLSLMPTSDELALRLLPSSMLFRYSSIFSAFRIRYTKFLAVSRYCLPQSLHLFTCLPSRTPAF